MSIWRLATRSLVYFWRTNLALLAGISIATAVLTGALIVGDSVRESLKSLTRERLGRIDEILIGQQFFDQSMVASLAATMPSTYTDAIPAILVNQATIEATTVEGTQRAQAVTVLGIPAAFWALDTTGLQPTAVGEDQIVINQALADELKVQVGDTLILRVGTSSGIAADSPLARKEGLVQSLVDLEVVQIIPARGLGRFSLQASQQIPANAFLNLTTLQQGLDQEQQANAIFVASPDPERVASGGSFEDLKKALQPTLSDLGLSLDRVELQYQNDDRTLPVLEYDTLINERMIYTAEQADAVHKALSGVPYQPLSTYMATKLQRLSESGEPTGDIIAYSTIAAVDSVPKMGPLMDQSGQPIRLEANEIVLNDWTAQAMGAQIGEQIRVTYFEPESSHHDPVEVSEDLTLKAIVPLTPPDEPFSRRRDAVFLSPPTLANDPHLTPEVEGITDAESIDRWDAPFPMDRALITGRDDDYWAYYRTTPKAFVSKSAGERLWTSRFGHVTSFRAAVADGGLDSERLATSLSRNYEAFDLTWLRAKRDGEEAARGTTPFDVLFLGFSQFIILSALILVALLLRLSLEQRARQIGLLQAVGLNWTRTYRALLFEMSLLVVLGGVVGAVLGIGYGQFMVVGLTTWWVDAIVTPFMKFSPSPNSIALGLLLGGLAAWVTMAWTLRGFRSIAPSQLIAGVTTDRTELTTTKKTWLRLLPLPLFGLAIIFAMVAPTQPTATQGGVFFGSGVCVLSALLIVLSISFQKRGEVACGGYLDLPALAFRNLTRNPTRSTLTIGLVAAACFLIIAISAFRLSPSESGTGGFEYVGTSDQPIFTSTVQRQLGDEGGQVSMLGLRLQDGDDASCRNLFQSRRPRLIGVTSDFIDRMKEAAPMQWAGTEATESRGRGNPWRLLQSGSTSDAIPVVIDKATAMYGMQIYGGVGTEFERDYGDAGKLKFRIVGFLAGSIFQGSLLVPEDRLIEHFPRVSGYRYFLVDVDGANTSESRSGEDISLEDQFSDEGLDLTSTNALLTELLAVQNTYLSTFQSLGGLGLLLGTLGLAAVQVRNVVQRRRELALLRATGFRNSQLSALILREHSLLLFGGLSVGTVAALVVVLPHVLFGGASIPVWWLLATLALVVVVGVVSGLFAQRALQSSSLIGALRDE